MAVRAVGSIRSFVQSFGFATTLNFGAGAESPICHSSISRPKNRVSSLGHLVQPIQRGPVLVREALRDPDDHSRAQMGGIGQQLAEVIVIRGLQLVFDDDLGAVVGVPAEDVGGIRAHGFLAPDELQRHPQRVAENRQVLLVSEPWGEVALLVWPDLAQVHGLESAEIGCRHGRRFLLSPASHRGVRSSRGPIARNPTDPRYGGADGAPVDCHIARLRDVLARPG